VLDLLRLDPHDSVATALRDLRGGERAAGDGFGLTPVEDIPRGHKVALVAIEAGAAVLKFGAPIGAATAPIAAGMHVHTRNLRTRLSADDAFRYAPEPRPGLPPAPDLTFRGYLRPDGRAATRNEVWVLPTVGCVARTAARIAAIARARHHGRVDGVHAFAHPFGCSQLGDDLDGTRAILASLACNPNAGGVLILGLGCESNQIDRLLDTIPAEQRRKVQTLVAQTEGDELEAGLALVDGLVAQASLAARAELPLSALTIGVKCGGSDGFSGLTANPLVGRMTDRVTGAGGSAILTEVPELFGAEQLLMNRADSRAVFEGLVELIGDFKRHFTSHGQPVSENPSPGNIAGGITTLEEKSLGAVQKAGRAPVMDVRRYGERLRKPGLTVLEAPGNDAVSSTALAAAGATLILFTAGRGTPLGFPVPTIKIASNSGLAAAKRHWIDFDAGQVLEVGFAPAEAALLARLIAIACGEPTAAERNDEREMAIWKRGVTL
jgi:altronate hydrolase